jgi:hypothetical protein
MKVALAAVIVFLAPGAVMGRPSELRLNCITQSLFDVNKNTTEKISESFSAVVRMGAMNNGSGPAAIEVSNIPPCQIYVGSFNDLEVSGSCEKTAVAVGLRLKGFLKIDRTNGAFQQTMQIEKVTLILSGQCKPAGKLF